MSDIEDRVSNLESLVSSLTDTTTKDNSALLQDELAKEDLEGEEQNEELTEDSFDGQIVVRKDFEIRMIEPTKVRIYQGRIRTRMAVTKIPAADTLYIDHELDGGADQYLWIRYNRTSPSSYVVDNTANDPPGDEEYEFLVLGLFEYVSGAYRLKKRFYTAGDHYESLTLSS